MNINLLDRFLLPYFLEPIDMIIRIMFDNVLTAAIIASVIYFVILIIRKTLLRNSNPYMRYYLWYALIIALLLSHSTLLPLLVFEPLYTLMADSFGMTYNHHLHSTLSIIWIAIVITKLFVYLKSRKLFAYTLKKTSEVTHCLAFEEALNACKIKEKIYLRVCTDVDSPASFGIMKKYIILPQCYTDKYTETELYCLFLHELVHIKKRDTSKNFILEIIHIIFWFNPIIGKAVQGYKDDCEIICDLYVLSSAQISKEDYFKLLIKELYSKNHTPLIIGLHSGFDFMKHRLTVIKNFSLTVKPMKCKRLAMLIIFLFSMCVYIFLVNACTAASINNSLLIINYDDGTIEKTELSNDNPNISFFDGKAIINTGYLTNILDKDKTVKSLEVFVADIYVGLFAVYSQTNNHYKADKILYLLTNNSAIALQEIN